MSRRYLAPLLAPLLALGLYSDAKPALPKKHAVIESNYADTQINGNPITHSSKTPYKTMNLDSVGIDYIDANDNVTSYVGRNGERIPILMFHRFGYPESRMVCSPDRFRSALQYLHDNNYHLITFEQAASGDYKKIPGSKPAVITFDDGAESQFRYLSNGQIDPNCAVGIMESFEKENLGFNAVGTFFVNMSSGIPAFGKQSEEQRKFQYLIENESEIGSHGANHIAYGKSSTEAIRRDLDKFTERAKQVLPDYEIKSFAYPYGSIPTAAGQSVVKEFYPNTAHAWGGIAKGGSRFNLSRVEFSLETKISSYVAPAREEYNPLAIKLARAASYQYETSAAERTNVIPAKKALNSKKRSEALSEIRSSAVQRIPSEDYAKINATSEDTFSEEPLFIVDDPVTKPTIASTISESLDETKTYARGGVSSKQYDGLVESPVKTIATGALAGIGVGLLGILGYGSAIAARGYLRNRASNRPIIAQRPNSLLSILERATDLKDVRDDSMIRDSKTPPPIPRAYVEKSYVDIAAGDIAIKSADSIDSIIEKAVEETTTFSIVDRTSQIIPRTETMPAINTAISDRCAKAEVPLRYVPKQKIDLYDVLFNGTKSMVRMAYAPFAAAKQFASDVYSSINTYRKSFSFELLSMKAPVFSSIFRTWPLVPPIILCAGMDLLQKADTIPKFSLLPAEVRFADTRTFRFSVDPNLRNVYKEVPNLKRHASDNS